MQRGNGKESKTDDRLTVFKAPLSIIMMYNHFLFD